MSIELKILEGPLAGKKMSFEDYQKISIGRSPKANISFPEDKKISRLHCLLEILPPGYFYVQDLQSRNGTFIARPSASNRNYQRVSEIYAQNGDIIKVGGAVFTINWPKQDDIPDSVCEKCEVAISASQCASGLASMCGTPLCSQCREGERSLVGKQVGGFKVLHRLGSGGMGTVYLVNHIKSHYQYAIKIAHPNLPPQQPQIDRFLREAKLGSKIKHPNIVRYYGCDYIEEGSYFLIPMEYVPGVDLNKYFAEKLKRPFSVSEAVPLILQIMEAAEFLHQNDMIHRDITPLNILVFEKENKLQIKLADFGLAKNYTESGLSGITLSNKALGNPAFMAPEQYENARYVDFRADIYSIGATIYFLLTNQKVYENTGKIQLFYKVLFEPPAPLHEVNPQVPKSVSDVIMKCLAKKPEQRYSDIAQLRQDFMSVLR